ncbi:MAG: dihydroneopterin aldolase [Inquilinus sp.]|nr:dihydroneopterin aldolase [Inquilinus sp.]
MNKPLSDFAASLPGDAVDTAGLRRLLVRDLVLTASIGIYEHEKAAAQRVRINLDIAVDDGPPAADRIDAVVSYEPMVLAAREIVAAGHIELLETLAERLAARCLADPRVRSARVRVEKLDAFPDAAAVGVEIERRQPASPAGGVH